MKVFFLRYLAFFAYKRLHYPKNIVFALEYFERGHGCRAFDRRYLPKQLWMQLEHSLKGKRNS